MRQTVAKNKEDMAAILWNNRQKLIDGLTMEQFLANWLDSFAEGLLKDGATIEDAINSLRQQVGNGTGSNTFNTEWFKVLNGFVDFKEYYLALPHREALDIPNLFNVIKSNVLHVDSNGVTSLSFKTDDNGVSIGINYSFENLASLIPAGSRVRVTFEASAVGMESMVLSAYGISINGSGVGYIEYDNENQVLLDQYGHYTIERDFVGAGANNDDATTLDIFLRREGSTGDQVFPAASSIRLQNIKVEYWPLASDQGGLRLPVGNLLLTAAGSVPNMPPAGVLPGDEGFDLSSHIIPGQLAINVVDEKIFYNNGAAIKEFVVSGGGNITIDEVPTKDSANVVASGGVYKTIKQTFLVESISDTGIVSHSEPFRITSINAESGLTVSVKFADGSDYTLGDPLPAFDKLYFAGDTLDKSFTVNGEIL